MVLTYSDYVLDKDKAYSLSSECSYREHDHKTKTVPYNILQIKTKKQDLVEINLKEGP